MAYPAAVAAAFLSAVVVERLLSAMATGDGGAGAGYGLIAAFAPVAVGTVAFVLTGVVTCPGSESWVCVTAFGLSQFFSPAFFFIMGFGNSHGTLLAKLAGLAGGGLLGIVLGWHVQRRRRTQPRHPAEGSGDAGLKFPPLEK